MKHTALTRFLILTSLVLLVGCKNQTTSTDGASPSSSTADSGENTAASPSGKSSEQHTSAKKQESESAALRVAAAKPIRIDSGTSITISVDQQVSSKDNNSGDHFEASVAEPVVVGDRVVIPKGAKATGTVTDAKSAGRFKGNAAITVTLSSITVDGKEYEVKASEVTESGKGRGKRTAEGAGGGAVVGALIGALAGGGKGAAIGAGAGAGAGTAGTALTGSRDITISAETKLSFRLTEPLEVRKK